MTLTTLFSTKIQSIGEEAHLFQEEKMIVLFGKEAPVALAEYCYVIESSPVTAEITKDQIVVIDNQPYPITSVGEVVMKNLSQLGHITIKFDGAPVASLPGTLHVVDQPIPELVVGSKISIESK